LKKGELVYIPSKVVLFDKERDHGTVRCKETDKPIQALCLGVDNLAEGFLRILHEGKQWTVHRRDAKEILNVN
jgi:hypothetical protein